MNAEAAFSRPRKMALRISSWRRPPFSQALITGVVILTLVGISVLLVVKPEELASGEKKFTGDDYEHYERLRTAAEKIEHKRIQINVYDRLMRYHLEDKEYTEKEKEGWKKEILKHKEEFNVMAKSYNDKIMVSRRFTNQDKLPKGVNPLPPRFELYTF